VLPRHIDLPLRCLVVAVLYPLHQHVVCRAGAASVIRDGLNIPEVRKALGQSSIATKATFLSQAFPIKMVQKLNARRWVF
jgi:hypothetical protein